MMDIKLFITDVDGTLTDGCIIADETGIPIKKYNTRDFCGMAMLNELGVKIAVLTGDPVRDPLLKRFNHASPYVLQEDIRTGVYDKEVEILGIMKLYGLEIDQVAYIGDEINDLEIMKDVKGYIGCPSDAIDEIKEIVSESLIGYVSTKKGGDGAVRDFCEYILRCNGVKPFWTPNSFRGNHGISS